MGSDWDYINEHMGGHNEDGLPNFMDDPCFNDDWEQSLRESGSKSVQEWNALGRMIKKGGKGTYLPCAKLRVFSEEQTIESKFNGQSNVSQNGKLHFKTFSEATTWAKSNPGKIITRSPTGEGYIEK